MLQLHIASILVVSIAVQMGQRAQSPRRGARQRHGAAQRRCGRPCRNGERRPDVPVDPRVGLRVLCVWHWGGRGPKQVAAQIHLADRLQPPAMEAPGAPKQKRTAAREAGTGREKLSTTFLNQAIVVSEEFWRHGEAAPAGCGKGRGTDVRKDREGPYCKALAAACAASPILLKPGPAAVCWPCWPHRCNPTAPAKPNATPNAATAQTLRAARRETPKSTRNAAPTQPQWNPHSCRTAGPPLPQPDGNPWP